MKKKVLVLSSLVVFILIVGIVTLFYSDDDKVIFESGKSNSVVRSNAITMMYETGYKTGEYQVTSDNVWPESGYTYNESLSTCENGSKIYWNSETNKVMMEATTADKCYVYFDKAPRVIQFSIGNHEYSGKEGMSWLSWANSSYNTTSVNTSDLIDITAFPDDKVGYNGREFYYYFVDSNENIVFLSDYIIENETYSTKNNQFTLWGKNNNNCYRFDTINILDSSN